MVPDPALGTGAEGQQHKGLSENVPSGCTAQGPPRRGPDEDISEQRCVSLSKVAQFMDHRAGLKTFF